MSDQSRPSSVLDKPVVGRAFAVGEPVSPELVLVSPELRERAIAALPERPWEMFLPQRVVVTGPTPLPRPRPIRVPSPLEPNVVPRATPLRVPEPVRVPEVESSPHGDWARNGPRGRRRGFWRSAVAPTATVALIIAAIAWASERTPVPRFSADGTPEATTERPPSASGGVVPPRPASPGQSSSQPSPTPENPAVPSGGPLPSGGYVFAGGSMVTNAKGTAVEIVLTQGCGRGARTPPVPVDAGRFAYRGQLGKVKLAIRGTFVDERHARVRIETTGPECAGPHEVVAELS